MPATTTLLGLVTPTQGTLSGTWGDTVNYGISDYVDISVAGTLTLTNDGAVTLANTTGSSSGNSITSSLTGAGTVTAQFAIVRVTGTLTVAKVVTGPSYSKTYTVVNAATGGIVTFKASGQTGVSIAVGETAFVYFNGTDYVKVVGTATAGAAGGSTTQVQFNSSGVLAGSANMTFNGTTLTVNDLTDSSLTSGRVTYAGASGNLVDSANLTFDGTNLTVGGSATAARFIPSGSTVATNGMYLIAADTLGFSTASTERMRIGSTGGVGISATTLTQFGLRVSKSITGNVASYGIRSDGVVQSDVTTQAFNFNSTTSTAASSFTLGQMIHYGATQSTIGAGSTVTNQYGYLAESTLTGATNNYGFYGGIASGTGRYNLYMNGTADNYLGGNLGIGSTDLPSTTLHIQKSTTGATTARGVWFNNTVASDVTVSANAFQTSVSTQAAAFTLTNLRHFYATQGTIGATSTLTNQFGFFADSTLTGATNNYGFYGNIASGTGRFNLYMAGTADNYLGGNIGIGTALSAWSGNYRGSQAGSTAFFGGNTAANRNYSSSNVYRDGANYRYMTTSFATILEQSDGAFYWLQAPSGTAGNNITFTTPMTLDASGNLGLGTNAPGSKLDVKGTLRLSGSSSGYVGFAPAAAAGSTTYTLPSADGTSGQFLSTNGSGTLSWATGGGGSATPAGSNTQVQFNNSGAFGASSLFTFDGSQISVNSVKVGRGAGSVASNTAIGDGALGANTTGPYCTVIGQAAGASSITAEAQTFLGWYAGNASTASGNTFVGAYAGGLITSGGSNTLIGRYSGNQDGLDMRTLSNYAVISDGAGNRLISTANGQTLALDSAVPNTGTGITFPATQSASSNANTLDDYEEGTFTPTDNSGAGLSLTNASGRYTKIGNRVFFGITVTYPSTASTSGASLTLPFACATVSPDGSQGAGALRYTTYTSMIFFPVVSGNATVVVYGPSALEITNANLSTKRIDFWGTYLV